MENQATELVTKFEEAGVIISDNKQEDNAKVTVTIDSKMVHLKEKAQKSRFDRIIPLRQVASCEVRRKSNTKLKWILRIIGIIMILVGIDSGWGVSAVGIILFIISFFIHDDFYVEIAASNGVPIRCKFEAKNKDDDVNERFVAIVRQLICDIQ